MLTSTATIRGFHRLTARCVPAVRGAVPCGSLSASLFRLLGNTSIAPTTTPCAAMGVSHRRIFMGSRSEKPEKDDHAATPADAANTTSTEPLSEKDLIELNASASKAFEAGDYVEAIEAWERVAESKQHTPNSPTLMSCLNNLACAYGEMGDNVRKLKLLERSRDLVAKVYGVDHPQYGMVLYNMACAKEEMGHYAEMEQLLQDSLALHEKRFNPKHAKVGRVLLLLSAAHGYLGEAEAQLQTAERAHEIVRRHCGPEHVQTAVSMLTLARGYGATGQVGRQLQLAQAAMTIQEKRLGPKNPQLALTLEELAQAHRANGDHHNERALLEEAVELQQRHFGQQHTHLIDTYIALGDACGALEDTKTQAQYYLEAYRIARKRFQGRHIAIGKAGISAAKAYLIQGKVDAARKLLDEVRPVVHRNVSAQHPLSKKLEVVTAKVEAMEKSDAAAS